MESNADYDKLLAALEEYSTQTVINDSKASAVASINARDEKEIGTRSGLTYIFLIGFFLLIILGAVFVFIYNAWCVQWAIELQKNNLPEVASKITPLELDKILSILIGAFGTSLGFIIGYYFKESRGS
ncbi:hypothetical protein LLR08_16440 [Rouxiella badensis]|uniref:hypothetical protein n=1 Tax=Rouxiella badensis TaxID=1646377 RepID=UPI001D14B417|nr:hypothetical protein [Rouxiella badensis]MCC3704151.1 hypothetical protein [Rouxiella badensis]